MDRFRRSTNPLARTLTTLFALAVLTLAIPAAPASAAPRQDAPAAEEAPAPTFGASIDVRVVNVEVVATDRFGNRVAGLGPDAFRLFVDGEEVPISYFSEIRGGDAVATEGEAAGAVPGLPALAAGEPVGTSYLVFVDDYFPIERDRNRVLSALAADLPQLRPGDRMAIVAFDGKQVEMLTSWTDSQPKLDRALDEAARRPAFGLQWIGVQRGYQNAFLRTRPRATRLTSSFDLTVEERGFAQEVHQRLAREVAAVVATMRGFAQPPGRKVMLVLSGGWPYSAGQYAANDLGRPLAGSYDYGYGPGLFQTITDTANLLGYTLYPVDVPGLGGDFGADVTRETRFASGLEPETSLASFERERLVQDSLHYLAKETGGEAMINAQRLDALPRVASDTRTYYWLGFTPDRNRDDARHDIRVEAVDRSLEVRTRRSFRDLSQRAENDMAVESALLFGDVPTGGRLAVSAGEPQRAGRKYIELPLKLTIPADAVTALPLSPGGDERVARLELRVAAHDAHNRTSEIPVIPFELRLPAGAPANAAVTYETRLKLRNDSQDLVISVHDTVSGDSLMARLEVEPTV